MKKIFLDTNIIIDIILEREGVKDAIDILQQGEDGKISLMISFLTVANAAYIIRKGHTKEQVHAIMLDLVSLFSVLSMDENQLCQALQSPVDLEDTFQYECAKAHGCDLIITRNCKHFPISGIPVMTPSDYLRGVF